MVVLIRKFRKSKDDDYEHKSSIVGSLRLVLKAMDKGLVPHEKYDKEAIFGLVKSLIDGQEEDGSWRVHLESDQPTEEDLCDFVIFPSLIDCSILSWVKQNMNYTDKEALDNVLVKGLKFAISRNLEGFGYNSEFQTLESLIILTEGKVPELLNSDPRICPPLYERILELRQGIQQKLDSGDTKMPFGGDYKETYEFITSRLVSV